jgi:hypothetical protein
MKLIKVKDSKPKRILKVSDGLLDLTFLNIFQKKGIFPFLVKAVGIYIALKMLFGEKKETPKHNQMIGLK